MSRPDQENWDTLQAHGKRTNFGEGDYHLNWHGGFLVKWKATKVEEGSQAPLKKIRKEEEEE